MVLANAGLGAVHGLVAPLGGRFQVPHGAACACLLPHTLTINHRALTARLPTHRSLPRYEEITQIVLGAAEKPGSPRTAIERTADALEDLRHSLGVSSLPAFGIDESAVEPVIAGSRGGSMRANPIDLTDDELATILQSALSAP
jgi:alcohol dehydrogenase class IV